MVRLSILIPLYNKEKYIERCLKSLLSQDISLNEYEVIIVDDGSTDSSNLIVREFTEKYANVHFFEQVNAGPSAARNKALEKSKGDFVYFLDADDYLAANVLKLPLDMCHLNSLEILEFNTKEVGEHALTNTVSENSQDQTIRIIDGITYIAEYGFRNEAWRYFINKDFLIRTGIKFIEGTLYEDIIFTSSLFLKASRMSKVNLDVHRYVVVQNSIVTSTDRAHNLKFIDGMVYAVKHFHGLINSLNSTGANYNKAIEKLKAKQQALVFSLIIRTYKFRLLNYRDFNKILEEFNNLEAYPIDPKIGGVGKSKSKFLPIINNKALLLFGTKIMRFIPSH